MKTESGLHIETEKNIHLVYDQYRLQNAKKYIRMIAIIACLLNIILMIPDWKLIDETPHKFLAVSLRALFALSTVGVILAVPKLKRFNQIAAVVTSGEILALAIYLFVMPLYSNFNYMIQAMGIIAFILIIF